LDMQLAIMKSCCDRGTAWGKLNIRVTLHSHTHYTTDTQTDRQAGRQTGRQAGRQAG